MIVAALKLRRFHYEKQMGLLETSCVATIGTRRSATNANLRASHTYMSLVLNPNLARVVLH